MVDRPNLMVKVPGIRAGVPAVRQLIEEGITINITLLFAHAAYKAVAEAFFSGLEARVGDGKPVNQIARVARCFTISEDRRVGKPSASPGRARWSPYHEK